MLRLLVLLPLLWACTPLDLLDQTVNETAFRRVSDVAYGEQPRQRLDLYMPPRVSGSGQRPVVIFFYGGNWRSGQREAYRFVGEALSGLGAIALVVDYRLYPQVQYPTFVEDAALAIAWTLQNVHRYGGDPERVFVLGHSAGAYLAFQATLDPQYALSTRVRGLMGLAGPYDFLPFDDNTGPVFASAQQPQTTQPMTHVRPGLPPILLLSGEDDRTVDPGNSLRLAAQLRASGNPVQVILYPEVGHAAIVGAFARPLRTWAPTLRDVNDFIIRH